MQLQCFVRFQADTDNFLCQAQSVVAFGKQCSLGGIGLCPVLTGKVYHRIAYLSGMNTFASGEQYPFGGQVDSGQVARCQRKDEGVRPDLIEYGRYDFIVRQDGMYEVFGRIGELRKRLLHFYLLRKVYKCSGRLQAGHPESIQLPTFGTGYVDAFVGYLQALVAFVQQLQRLVKAKLMLRSFLCGREALRRDGVVV